MNIALIMMLAGGLIFVLGFGFWLAGRNPSVSGRENQEREHSHTATADTMHKLIDLVHGLVHKGGTAEYDVNKENGNKFENYVVDKFHEQSRFFEITRWASDKITEKGNYATSNTDPDLEVTFSLRDRKYQFAVECKWRRGFLQDSIEFRMWQIANYKRYQDRKKQETFLILGVGEPADNPEHIFIIPVADITKSKFTKPDLTKYYQGARKRGEKYSFFYDAKEKTLNIRGY